MCLIGVVRFCGPPPEPDVPVPEHPALHVLMPLLWLGSTMVSGCGRLGSGSARWLPLWGEHLEVSGADLPARKAPPDQGVHVYPDVSFAQPVDDPPQGEVVDLAERARGHAVAEVVAPAPQRRVQAAQQVSERSVLGSAGQRAHLVKD